MGTIMSVEKALENVSWTRLPKGRRVDVEAALSLDDGSVLLRLKNDRFTLVGRYHVPNGSFTVLHYDNRTVLNGLVRMGVLTKEQVANHLARVKEGKAETDRKFAIRSLKKACEALGVPVPEIKG